MLSLAKKGGENMEEIVLGAGLAGLVIGYIKDIPVIGKEIGGQAANEVNLGPRILDANYNSVRFLNRLYKKDMVEEVEVFNPTYFFNGTFHNELNDDMRSKYFNKTRGTYKFTPSSMSGGNTQLLGWDMQKIGLVKKLKEAVNFRQEEVFQVDHKRLIVNGKEYKSIINTIPLPIFLRLCGLPALDLKAKQTNFAITKSSFDKDYSYIYIVDEELPFHRITNIGNNKHVFESHTAFDNKNIECFGKLFEIEKEICIRDCQIINNYDFRKIGNIELEGRYARWTQAIKISSIIDNIMA